MPSTKPQILIRTDKELIERIDKIASEQRRSRANMCELILSEYVEQYEAAKNQEFLKSQNIDNKVVKNA